MEGNAHPMASRSYAATAGGRTAAAVFASYALRELE
jgi:hypothetical protein